MNLIILTDADRTDDSRYRLDDHRAEHILSILKLTEGDTVEVGVLNGAQGQARIEAIGRDGIHLVCDELADAPVSRPEVDLICALPRPQTLKKILITGGMMGVRSLHLIRANRVEKSYFQSPLIEPENQLPFLIEGLAQGRNTRLPEVWVHSRFRPFFEDGRGPLADDTQASLKLLCSIEVSGTLDTVLERTAASVTIAIGPEGGWVPFEVELMRGVGFKPFTLGRWTLRVEHAVTAALSQIELLALMQR